MFLFRRGSKSVGQEIATSPAGRNLALKKLGVTTAEETTEESIQKTTLQIQKEINEGILNKTQGFARQIDNATSPAQQARLAKNTVEQNAKYADDLAIKLGDPALAPQLRKAFTRRTPRFTKRLRKNKPESLCDKPLRKRERKGLKKFPKDFWDGQWAI